MPSFNLEVPSTIAHVHNPVLIIQDRMSIKVFRVSGFGFGRAFPWKGGLAPPRNEQLG